MCEQGGTCLVVGCRSGLARSRCLNRCCVGLLYVDISNQKRWWAFIQWNNRFPLRQCKLCLEIPSCKIYHAMVRFVLEAARKNTKETRRRQRVSDPTSGHKFKIPYQGISDFRAFTQTSRAVPVLTLHSTLPQIKILNYSI